MSIIPTYINTNINHKHDILKHFLLKPKTIHSYTQCLSSFLIYIQIHFPHSPIFSHTLSSSTSSTSSSSSFSSSSVQLISELDRLLCNYVNYLYIHHDKHYKATNTFNALCFYLPQCKNQLYESHQRLRAWTKAKLPNKQYKTPFTIELTYVLALSLIKGNYIYYAIGVLLSFECYLRIGELCNIRICDIGKPTDTMKMIVGLSNTKTGPNQSVIIRCPFITSLILLLLQNKNENSKAKLFPFKNTDDFRHMFQSGCHILGLDRYHFSPHCLRHGGCTHDYVINQHNINTVIERGRWSASKSVRTYIHTLQYLNIHLKEKNLTTLGKKIIHQSQQLFLLVKSKLQQT